MRTKMFQKIFRMAGVAVALGLLAAAATAQTGAANLGRLKVCKVAGPGVKVGELFTFNIYPNNTPLQVPAGPAPGGYCKVGPALPIGQIVKVTEFPSNGSQVTNIKVDPPNRLVNLAGNSVFVQMGSGVTEVTFTNKRTGYLEICKEKKPPAGTGNYTFWAYANGSWFGPYTIPAGSCTHAVELPAGNVTIYEWPGNQLVSCNVVMPGSGGTQVSCDTIVGSSTVTVVPGDVSNQTIAVMTNKGGHPVIDDPANPEEAREDPR